MRVWLQKQKKKEEAKAASQAPPTPVETTPAAPEVQPVGDAADKPVESIEETPKAEGAGGEQIAEEVSGDADDRTGSAAVQTNEVGSISKPISLSRVHEHGTHDQEWGASFVCLTRMNLIVAACASDHAMHHHYLSSLGLILLRTPLLLKTRAMSDAAVQLRNS